MLLLDSYWVCHLVTSHRRHLEALEANPANKLSRALTRNEHNYTSIWTAK